MFSHIMIGTNDLDKAKSFYDAVLGTLGVPPAFVDGHRIFYMTPKGVFSVSKPIDGKPATFANGGTIGFACESAEQADVREGATGKMYLAYLRDPDGNKLCGLHRM
jgi:catechol 2,3-dioxygenase-like lactoylglutathione lyase family enzyme